VGARIRSFSYLEGTNVGTGAIVGPFARPATQAILEEAAISSRSRRPG
jgi:bifunctional N-acetylglucosamine-1-phosphate-uridyltransferase/glucosamine-1-phosphate-acetyltransferase GlmU-like protein